MLVDLRSVALLALTTISISATPAPFAKREHADFSSLVQEKDVCPATSNHLFQFRFCKSNNTN
jgi:hypothetical protein